MIGHSFGRMVGMVPVFGRMESRLKKFTPRCICRYHVFRSSDDIYNHWENVVNNINSVTPYLSQASKPYPNLVASYLSQASKPYIGTSRV